MRNSVSPMMTCILTVCFFALGTSQAQAHASEQGFVLLLPTQAYISGGTLAVFASIVLVTVLSPNILNRIFSPFTFARPPQMRGLTTLSSLISTACCITLVGIGLFGPTDPQSNLLPLTIWTVFWVGVFIVQAFLVDIWKWINPWAGLHRLLIGNATPIYKLHHKLQAWPAVVLLLMFQIFAISDIAPSDPRRLANVVAGYWIFTFLGMVIFGRKPWLERVEVFSVLFRLIGTLRAIDFRHQTRIGIPGWNALGHDGFDRSLAVFCLVVLATGSFDGLHETFWWLAKIGINPLEFPGRSAIIYSSTIGTLISSIALVCSFAFAVWIGVLCTGKTNDISLSDAFNRFAVSILPIAVGYHFAHFLVSFLVQIQYAALAFADPFQQGWDIMGLKRIQFTTGFLKSPDSVRAIWFTQVAAVVISHILSVMMAHHVAGTLVKTRKDGLLLQIGLSVLMIAYTVFGLWLLATARGM